MGTKIIILHECIAIICFLGFFTGGANAQETTTRLYIPTSSQTTLIKEGNESSMIVKDYLGSTRQKDFYPYGTDVKNTASTTDRQFTGHRNLEDAHIYHAGARFYSPELGQFIQADEAEGPQRYAYALNNPVTHTDPTGNCVECQQEEPQYIDISDYYTQYALSPEFRGADIYQMPPDQGISDSIYYPVVGGAAAGAVVAGGIYAAPVVAGSGVVSSIGSAASTALEYSAVQGAIGSVGVEAIGQGIQGKFDGEKLVTQGIVGAVGGKWIGAARGFISPRYASLIEKSPALVRAAANTKVGHLAYEFTAESAIVSPLIAYGTAHDMRKVDGPTFGKAFLTNYLATKAGLQVAMLGRYGGGKLGGVVTKKALNKMFPQIEGILTNTGTYFGLTNHLRTNNSIQEPLRNLEAAIVKSFMGKESYAH